MTSTDICNLALSYLGDSATVARIDPPEGSAQAQHCARFYPIAQKMMLEGHQWNFATKRVKLAAVTGIDLGWQYAYQLPSDCTDLISLLPSWYYDEVEGYPAGYTPSTGFWLWGYGRSFGWGNWWAFPFEEEIFNRWQIEGTTLLTNVENPVARYSSTEVQAGSFPALFANALARLLASMLAGPLIKGDEGQKAGQTQYAWYQRGWGEAVMQDANQRHGKQERIPAGIVARF